jgi:hypothetical protein
MLLFKVWNDKSPAPRRAFCFEASRRAQILDGRGFFAVRNRGADAATA